MTLARRFAILMPLVTFGLVRFTNGWIAANGVDGGIVNFAVVTTLTVLVATIWAGFCWHTINLMEFNARRSR